MSQSGVFFNGTTPPPGSGIQTVTGNTGGPVGPDGGGNIDIVGAGPITVDGNAGTFTETINIANATTTAVGVVELATDAETITGTDSVRAVVPSSLKAKLGVQTDHAVAIGNTDSLAIQWSNVGTDGQVLIAATGADPAFATVTSTGGTIAITGGANTLNLEAVGSGASITVDADSGSAAPIANILNLNGAAGGNITTTGAGNTLTVAVSGTTNHAVQVGNATGSLDDVAVGATNTVLLGNTGANPSFGQVPNAALVNSTITVTGDQNITVGGSPVALGGALTLAFPNINQYELVTADAGGAAESLPAGTGTSGQVLTSQGAAAYPIWATPNSGSVIATQFTASGTWTKNTNTQTVEILIIGAGSGGGSGSRGSANSGASVSMGGGGGACSGSLYMKMPALFFPASLAVTVGAGGSGGAAVAVDNTAGNDGSLGGSSSVGSLIKTYEIGPNYSFGQGGHLTGTVANNGLGAFIRYFEAQSNIQNGLSTNYGLVNPPAGPGRASISPAGVNSATDGPYFMTAGAGGGGCGSFAGVNNTGGNGSNIRSCFDSDLIVSGGGGTIVIAAGAGGAVPGASGAAGSNYTTTNGYLSGGSGGGGGAGVTNVADAPGNGGNGGYPGGGGGGGAGGMNASVHPSGSGGDGADSMIVIVEYLGTFTIV
jgi:hypothetical protein